MFFKDIICIKFPSRQGYGSPFLASYCGNNSGTDMLKQHARSAASCMLILVHNRRYRRLFSLFPLFAHLSHCRSRGFESLQVHLITPTCGRFFLSFLHMGVNGLVLGIKTEIVCNHVQRGYTMVIDSTSFTLGDVNSLSICSAASPCETNQKGHQYFERVGIPSLPRYFYRFVWRQIRHRQTSLIVHC
jgi:hypothetical protein